MRKVLLIATCVNRFKAITLESCCWSISYKFQVNSSTSNNLPKHHTFTGLLIIIGYVQSALLILFFHNKLFYNNIEQIKPESFFCLSASGYIASFAQQKQPSNATEKDITEEAFSITKKWDELHHRHFSPEILLRFGATTFALLKTFCWIILKNVF